jgi:hypothetical protein
MARLGVPVGGRVRKSRTMGDPLARLLLKSPGLLFRLVGLPIRQQDRPNRPDKPDRQSNLPHSTYTAFYLYAYLRA